MHSATHQARLATLVSGLLSAPTLFCDLESDAKHQALLADIERVLAKHCGPALPAASSIANGPFADSLIPNLTFPMVDWRLSCREPVAEETDVLPYTVRANIGNQSSFEFIDAKGESCFGIIIEVNNGVPAVHFELDDGCSVLHVHAAHGGLVLTPDCRETRFTKADIDRYSYDDGSALLIK